MTLTLPATRKAQLPTPAEPQTLARWTPFILTGLTAIGFVLRIWEIGTKGLRLDEAFSVWLGWQPLGEMLSWLVQIDQHPPFYYALLHFWIKLAGDTPNDVRLPSAILGTLTIPVMFLLGRRLMGTTVGLLAALILALSPFHVRFAQETRMYTVLTLNASLALLALSVLLTDARSSAMTIGQQLGHCYRTWRADRRRPPISAISTDLAWIGVVVFTAATLFSHNTAVLFLLATNLFVVGFVAWQRVTRIRDQESGVSGQRSRIRDQGSDTAQRSFQLPASSFQLPTTNLQPPTLANWLIAQLGVFLLWSPWLVAFVIQAANVYRDFWISKPTFGVVLDTLKAFLSAMLPVEQIGWADVIWAAYGLLAILGIVRLRKQPALIAFLAVLFLTPIIGEWLVSLHRPIFSDRTLIWTTLPLYLLLASGITQLRYRPTILATVVILVAVNLLSLRQYYIFFDNEEWDRAAAYVGERAEQDDMLLFHASWVQIPFDYYFRYQNRSVAKHGAPVDLFDRGILEPKMAESDLPRLRELIADTERVWLIYSHDWYTDPENLIPAALSQSLELLDQRPFNGLEVRLYGRP